MEASDSGDRALVLNITCKGVSDSVSLVRNFYVEGACALQGCHSKGSGGSSWQ